MSFNPVILRNNVCLRRFSSIKRNFTVGKIIFNKPSGVGGGGGAAAGNVPGLSANVCNVPKEAVGPGATKTSNYKNPEYFCYDKNSYFEAEVEMSKFRCPQPSTKEYWQPKKAK